MPQWQRQGVVLLHWCCQLGFCVSLHEEELGSLSLGKENLFCFLLPALILIGNKLIEFPQAESTMIVFGECSLPVLISTHEHFAVSLYPCPVVGGSVALGTPVVTPSVPDSGSCQVCRALSALWWGWELLISPCSAPFLPYLYLKCHSSLDFSVLSSQLSVFVYCCDLIQSRLQSCHHGNCS